MAAEKQKVLLGVSNKLLSDFDAFAEKLQKSRSEAIREAMRFFVKNYDKVELPGKPEGSPEST